MREVTTYPERVLGGVYLNRHVKSEHSRNIRSYLLTQEEMKKLFRVTKRTIQRWTKKNLIPSVKVGGTTRYDIEDVRDVLGMNQDDIYSLLNEESVQ